MEPYAVGVIIGTVMIALLGLVIVGFAVLSHREFQRNSRIATKQLHPDRSGRRMAVGFIIFALAVGLLIGVFTSYLARFFSG